MNALLTRNSGFLRQLYESPPTERKILLENSTAEQIEAISLIASQILNGQILLSRSQSLRLRRHRRVLQSLANTRISINRKRRILLYFHEIVPLLAQQVLLVMDES